MFTYPGLGFSFKNVFKKGLKPEKFFTKTGGGVGKTVKKTASKVKGLISKFTGKGAAPAEEDEGGGAREAYEALPGRETEGLPKWVVPAAIAGAGGLILLTVIMKRRE